MATNVNTNTVVIHMVLHNFTNILVTYVSFVFSNSGGSKSDEKQSEKKVCVVSQS